MAEQAELDLVEISPNAEPPVCRIMNYGKFLYEKSKTAKEQKKKQKVVLYWFIYPIHRTVILINFEVKRRNALSLATWHFALIEKT